MSNSEGTAQAEQSLSGDDTQAEAQAEIGAQHAPVKVIDRIGSLDFIRGIAVMGILAANIIAFGQPSNAYIFPDVFMNGSGDPGGWMWIAQFVLIDGKMRALFTILFGAGMYLFMERTWARGGTRWRQIWRLAILLVIGLIHFFFIWMGDILFYYGFLGLAAVACLRWSAKSQLMVGLVGSVVGGLLYLLMFSIPYLVADTSFGDPDEMSEFRAEVLGGIDEALAEDAVDAKLIIDGDYAGWVAHRTAEDWWMPLGNSALFVFETLPYMLLGMGLYRYGFFSGALDRRKMIRWGWAGLAVGGITHLAIGLFVWSGGLTFYEGVAAFSGWSALPRIPMVLGFAALMVVYSPAWTGWLGSRISAAGRAAFTNYLGTSIVMMFVFHGWALGLFGELNRPQLYGVTALTCLLMLAWSKPWLDRFRYGPLEWLWRCLTYGKLFPMKR